MLKPKLLWIAAENSEDLACDSELHVDFELFRTSELTVAVQALSSTGPECVLVSGKFPGIERLDILEALRRVDPLIPVIFYDAWISAAEGVLLFRNGAQNCFCSTDDTGWLRRALDQSVADFRAKAQNSANAGPAQKPRWLMSQSTAMREVHTLIQLIAPRRCTVLITGETGTGKEMAARELHAASPRACLPMITMNCGALPEHLLEAELFGHVKGAFTGAISNRVGRFEQAHRSTIFLDEIGEMPMDLQVKLLRVLQEREVQRLGSGETIKVDVRVIAATNCDLNEKVRQGKFRADLFYRLNVVPLHLPRLEERSEDIPLLVDHFVAKFCLAEDIPAKLVPADVKDQLRNQPWPGNVRQLENSVEMAVAVSGDRTTIRTSDFRLTAPKAKIVDIASGDYCSDLGGAVAFDEAVNQFQLNLLRRALHETAGNKTAAAGLLGMKRTTLIMKMRGLEGAGSILARAI